MDVNPYIGRLFAFISACCFSLHAIIIRVYSKNLNPYSITHDEMIFTLLLSFFINHLIKGPEIVPRDNITSNILIIRGLIAFPGFSSCVVGMYFLPPQIFIVFNNSNLIFTIFISSLINKNYPAIKVILFIMVYIIGVVILVCPQLFGLPSETKIKNDYNKIYIVFPLISGVCGGLITNLLIMYNKSIHVCQNSYYFSLLITIFSGLVQSIQKDNSSQYETREKLLIPVLGLLMFLTQTFMMLACKYETRAWIVSAIGSSNIFVTFILDLIFLKPGVSFSNLLGATIGFLSLICISLFKDSK